VAAIHLLLLLLLLPLGVNTGPHQGHNIIVPSCPKVSSISVRAHCCCCCCCCYIQGGGDNTVLDPYLTRAQGIALISGDILWISDGGRTSPLMLLLLLLL
jgi:hypothetical protein